MQRTKCDVRKVRKSVVIVFQSDAKEEHVILIRWGFLESIETQQHCKLQSTGWRSTRSVWAPGHDWDERLDVWHSERNMLKLGSSWIRIGLVQHCTLLSKQVEFESPPHCWGWTCDEWEYILRFSFYTCSAAVYIRSSWAKQAHYKWHDTAGTEHALEFLALHLTYI